MEWLKKNKFMLCVYLFLSVISRNMERDHKYLFPDRVISGALNKETNTEDTTEISTESIDIDDEVKKVTETVTTEAEVKQTEELTEVVYTDTPESFESEEELINFLANREEEIKTIANDANSTELPVEMEDALKEDVKFIWYEQELGGYTYDSLSNASKVEVLDIFVETKQIVEEKYTNFSSEYTMLYVDDADLQDKYRSILDSIQAVEQKTLTK